MMDELEGLQDVIDYARAMYPTIKPHDECAAGCCASVGAILEAALADRCDVAREACDVNPHDPNLCIAHHWRTLRMLKLNGTFPEQPAGEACKHEDTTHLDGTAYRCNGCKLIGNPDTDVWGLDHLVPAGGEAVCGERTV